MRLMEDVFFSFTFGGETLSLAAAKAVLEKLDREPVIERLAETENKVVSGVARSIAAHGLDAGSRSPVTHRGPSCMSMTPARSTLGRCGR